METVQKIIAKKYCVNSTTFKVSINNEYKH